MPLIFKRNVPEQAGLGAFLSRQLMEVPVVVVVRVPGLSWPFLNRGETIHSISGCAALASLIPAVKLRGSQLQDRRVARLQEALEGETQEPILEGPVVLED